MKRRFYERRSVPQELKQIEQIEIALRDPALDPVQFALLQGARMALKWSIGAESIIPRNLAKRHADKNRSAA